MDANAQRLAEEQAAKDQELLEALQAAKAAIVPAEPNELDVELQSFDIVAPSRAQRRLFRGLPKRRAIVSPTAVRRRKVRRQIAAQSRNRNRR